MRFQAVNYQLTALSEPVNWLWFYYYNYLTGYRNLLTAYRNIHQLIAIPSLACALEVLARFSELSLQPVPR